MQVRRVPANLELRWWMNEQQGNVPIAVAWVFRTLRSPNGTCCCQRCYRATTHPFLRSAHCVRYSVGAPPLGAGLERRANNQRCTRYDLTQNGGTLATTPPSFIHHFVLIPRRASFLVSAACAVTRWGSQHYDFFHGTA